MQQFMTVYFFQIGQQEEGLYQPNKRDMIRECHFFLLLLILCLLKIEFAHMELQYILNNMIVQYLSKILFF